VFRDLGFGPIDGEPWQKPVDELDKPLQRARPSDASENPSGQELARSFRDASAPGPGVTHRVTTPPVPPIVTPTSRKLEGFRGLRDFVFLECALPAVVHPTRPNKRLSTSQRPRLLR